MTNSKIEERTPEAVFRLALAHKLRIPQWEHIIAESAEYSYKYATEIIKGRFIAGERAICQTSDWAFFYASDVIKGKWKDGEGAILKSPKKVYEYALEVLDERWPEGEKALIDAYVFDSQYLRDYIRDFFDIQQTDERTLYVYALKEGKPFPLFEPIIADNAFFAVAYAKHVLHGRFEKAEDKIAADGESAYLYATDVLNGRFIEGEPTIGRNLRMAKSYIKRFIPSVRIIDPEHLYDEALIQKKSFPIAERIIAENGIYSCWYASNVLHKRFIMGEPAILEAIKKEGNRLLSVYLGAVGVIESPKSVYKYTLEKNKPFAVGELVLATDPVFAYLYSYKVLKSRFHAAESIIATNPIIAFLYANNVIQGAFPEAEDTIKKNPELLMKYLHLITNLDIINPEFLAAYATKIEKRVPLAEPIIALEAQPAYSYATNVLKDRFPLAEEVIAKSTSEICFNYAFHLVKGRFEKGEPLIANHPSLSLRYAKEILHGRFEMGEHTKSLTQYESIFQEYKEFITSETKRKSECRK